ncbi:MAG: YihY/virulence factor BrkB family protein [Gemmatimonadota bacterium]|nr:YihY/virulence factor BrkB family protein [Gemmatimonadota bacterium]
MSTHLFIVRLWKKFAVDDAFLLSAAIAWGVLFAIVPFLALGIGLTGFVLSARFDDPTEAVLELFARNLPQGAAGEEFARMLDALVGEVMTSRTGLTVVGSLVFVWLATRLSGTLRSVLATVFETDNTRGIVHGKAFDIAVVLLGVFLVTLNIGVTVLGAAAVRFGVEIVGLGGGTVSIAERALGAGIAFLSIWTLFLLIYRYLPRVRTPWRTTLVASTFAGVVHEFVKFGFSWYVTEVANYASTLGNLATAALLLLWIYYGALVFILGGEVAHVYSVREVS